jgi:hypothetical protein
VPQDGNDNRRQQSGLARGGARKGDVGNWAVDAKSEYESDGGQASRCGQPKAPHHPFDLLLFQRWRGPVTHPKRNHPGCHNGEQQQAADPNAGCDGRQKGRQDRHEQRVGDGRKHLDPAGGGQDFQQNAGELNHARRNNRACPARRINPASGKGQHQITQARSHQPAIEQDHGFGGQVRPARCRVKTKLHRDRTQGDQDHQAAGRVTRHAPGDEAAKEQQHRPYH